MEYLMSFRNDRKTTMSNGNTLWNNESFSLNHPLGTIQMWLIKALIHFGRSSLLTRFNLWLMSRGRWLSSSPFRPPFFYRIPHHSDSVRYPGLCHVSAMCVCVCRLEISVAFMSNKIMWLLGGAWAVFHYYTACKSHFAVKAIYNQCVHQIRARYVCGTVCVCAVAYELPNGFPINVTIQTA